MTRLGLRLALAGGRGAVAGIALTAAAVAIGTAILLIALSLTPAVADRDARTAWRDGFDIGSPGSLGTLVLPVEDRVDGRLLVRVHVAAVGPNAPVPPAVAVLPAPGTAYVSPALAILLTELPADQLGDRFGRVVGTIESRSLASPDELLAVVGTDPVVLLAQGAMTVPRFQSVPAPFDLPPIGALIAILAAVGALAPVAVFVATATRMSAARRELRLAALRLVGATPQQVAHLAVVEALIATTIGAMGGVALFFVMRPLIARIPVDGASWWPESIVPPLPFALALFVAVQVVGAAGALVAMRRLTITPLGVQRRTVPPPPTARRVIPLACSVVGLLIATATYRSSATTTALAVTGLAFTATIGSIAFAGPWLTAVVGRALHRSANGAPALLAGRRLGDDPRGSFGAIAGVIMAVFVTSASFTFSAYASAQAGSDQDPLLQPNAVVVGRGFGTSASLDIDERIAAMDGVTGVVAIREVVLIRDEGIAAGGWVASCAAVVNVLALDGATCSPTGITTSDAELVGRFQLAPDTNLAGDFGADPVRAILEVMAETARPWLAAGDARAPFLPQVLIDPMALDDPSGAETLPVSRIHVQTDGSSGSGDRVRTLVVAAAPASHVRLAEERIASNDTFAEIGRVVALGLVGTLALAGCSLAIAVTTSTLGRRRQFVFLRSAGMPASALRATILLQAGVPLLVVSIVSAILGAVVGAAILWVSRASVFLPDVSLVGVLVLSLAVAMLIVALTLPPLERMTRPASLRHE